MGDILDVRYTELRFTVRLVCDSVLPRFKASAIRGGMGQMLLDEYCIREQFRKENNNICDNCDFREECIVQRILYAKMDIEPEFMSSGNSVGYIVECDDMRENYDQGDELRFKLILFGKNIYYLSQYLSAIYRLGQAGLGKEEAGFEVVSVCNIKNQAILEEGNIYKDLYKIESFREYIDYRIDSFQCDIEDIDEVNIVLKSPLAIKKEGEILQELNIDAFFENLDRRIRIMECFEGYDTSRLPDSISQSQILDLPNVLHSESRFIKIPRYSGRKNQKIYLKGVYGNMVLDLSSITDVSDKKTVIRKLLIGELLHVGSNTSFGFGGYKVLL